MKDQTIPVSTRLKPLLLARIDAWARAEKRTRCNMISLMLEEYLDEQSRGNDSGGSMGDHGAASDGRMVHEEVEEL